MKHLSAILIIIAILFLNLASGSAETIKGGESERLFGFAESLFEEEDYFRAISEYKRFIFLHSTDDAILAERASYRIAEAYFKAKRWSDAIAACNQFLTKFPESTFYTEVLYLKGRVEMQDRRYDDALRSFDMIINAKTTYYRDKALYQKALVIVEMANWQGASEVFLQVPKESPLFPSAASFAAGLANRDKIPRKSPVTAGILAATLPGAGHLYVERPQDALVSFLLNGAFIWGAVELFQHDNYVAGGIFAFFELGWYGGNIYSAVNSAHKYNRNKEEEFIGNLKNKFTISLYREGTTSSVLLSKKF